MFTLVQIGKEINKNCTAQYESSLSRCLPFIQPHLAVESKTRLLINWRALATDEPEAKASGQKFCLMN